jgi:hypothetical protein
MNELQTQQALASLAKKMGRQNASSLLSALGRDKQFINAIESSVGQELLADAMLEIENKISLYLSGHETPEDRAELNAYTRITKRWQAKIERYNKNKQDFEKGAN